jgi:hypothetical protein
MVDTKSDSTPITIPAGLAPGLSDESKIVRSLDQNNLTAVEFPKA